MSFRLARMLLNAQGGEGGGKEAPAPAPEPAPDLGKLVEAAVAKHGDQTAALKAFAADLYAARDDLKAARGKLPPEGAVILQGDDAKDWASYRQLGKPSDVRKVVDEHKTLGAEVAGFKRSAELDGVAAKAGVKPAVLKQLAGDLAFGQGKAKDPKTGKDVEVVTVKAGDAEPVPFDDYAKAHWGDFLPALRPEATPAAVARPNPTPPRFATAGNAAASGAAAPEAIAMPLRYGGL